MNINSAPCVSCDNKGCGAFHSKCEVYQNFRRQRDELLEKKNERNELNNSLIETRNLAIRRIMHQRRG